MSRFVQFHLLTSYPPSNLNRDDLGRPKSALFGGKNRLRISSQCLKRTWRTSDQFEKALDGHLGSRTRRVGEIAYFQLLELGVAPGNAHKWAREIAGEFGKVAAITKKTKGEEKSQKELLQELHTQQLVHISPAEKQAILDVCAVLAEENRAPEKDDLSLLRRDHAAADIAMFGRMLASATSYNMEAAVQVAHALTVHAVDIEDDYFTAVDDLNRPSDHESSQHADDDAGAAHIGELGFGAGVFYLYICVDRELLKRNLNDNEELVANALQALLEAASKTSPSGKQNSFASRALAHYVLAEQGDEQPRSLSSAFLKPITGENLLADAIAQLEDTRTRFGQAYGELPKAASLNVLNGEGSLADILSFVREG